MRKLLNLVLVVVASFSAVGSADAKSVEDPRMQMIWDSAYNRMAEQASIWYDAGDFPRSVQLLRLQYEIFPNDFDVVTNLGWMLENVEQYPAALATYIDFRHRNPEDPDAGLPEAQFYMLKRAFAKIPPLLEPSMKSKKAKPSHLTYRVLAIAYERLNLLSDAQRVLKAFLDEAPSDTTARNNLERVEKKIRGEIAVNQPSSS